MDRPPARAPAAEPDVAVRRDAVRERVEGGRWRRGLIRGTPPGVVHAATWSQRQWSSRALHRVGELSSHAGAGFIAAVLVVTWAVVGVVVGFPGWWETVLYSTTASVTFVMVFAIQHTQARQQSATQRKLDELLRALTSADDRLIAVEEAPDEELEALADLNLEDRENALS